MKVIAEGVRPQDDPGLAWIALAPFLEPIAKRLRGKPGHAALLGHSPKKFRQPRDSRRLGKEVGQPRGKPGPAGPTLDHSHGVSGPGADAAFIIMSEEFSLVSSHVHVHGTFC